MKFRLTLLVLVLIPFLVVGQVNLVLNPSFEDTFRCAADSNVVKTKMWFSPTTGSPDLYYPTIQGNPSCADQIPQYWGGGGYTNNLGYCLPRTGDAYAGMYVMAGGEFLANRLSDSLRPGKTYSVSFYVSLGDFYYSQGGQGLDLINLCFLEDSITDYTANDWMYLGTLTDDAGNQAGNFLTDTAGWMLVQDTFIADGGERYFVLGNIDTANTQYVNSLTPTTCYYYFDDFDVHCIDCTADTSEPPGYPEISVTPTLTSGQITLSGDFPEGSQFEVYNMLGQRIYYNELHSGNQSHILFLTLADGSYLFRVHVAGTTLKSGKIVLVH